MRMGDLNLGVSLLKRKYDYSESRLDWNQARIREAHTLLGDTDTNRLAAALPLLQETANLTRQQATLFLTGDSSRRDREKLRQRVDQLRAKGRELKPPLGLAATTSPHNGETANPQQSALITDDLSSLILDLTDNVFGRLGNREQHPPLAGYLAKTVLERHLKGATEQPWSLLGIHPHPQTLDKLRDTLNDLCAIVKHLARRNTGSTSIFDRVRSGKPKEALRRAARTSRQQEGLHAQTRTQTLERLCDSIGHPTRILHRQKERAVLLEFAINVELDSLFEWPQALTKLDETLAAQQPVDEMYLLVPCRNGRPIPRLVNQR